MFCGLYTLHVLYKRLGISFRAMSMQAALVAPVGGLANALRGGSCPQWPARQDFNEERVTNSVPPTTTAL